MILLIKNVFVKIRKSIGRFISIMLIIALGISVFIGLRESTAGMLYTADNYYDKHNLMDFKITSTYGLTKGDVASLKELKHVDKVIPSYSVDVLDNGKSIRVHALEKEINNVTLIQGRLPKKNNECIADAHKYKIGDIITFKRDDLKDFISIDKCKVVGLVNSVLYIRDEKGISNIGNGKLISFVFLNKKNFVLEYYTELYITANKSIDKNSYYEEYEESIIPLEKELKKLKPIRETIRYEEILLKASNEIAKIENDITDKINAEQTKLNKAKKELDKEQKNLNEIIKDKTYYFETNLNKLNVQKQYLLNELNNQNIKEHEIDTFINLLEQEINNAKELLSTLDDNDEQYNIIKNQIKTLEEKLNGLIVAKENLRVINTNLNALNNNYDLFKNEINHAKNKLNDGYLKYNNGLIEINTAKNKAAIEIDEAKEDLNNIEKPVWYLLNRKNNSGYISYKEDIIKVEAISKVLPIFFVLVVILMILNTLNRIIEEERTEMGILLANGFSKGNIIFEYLLYVLVSGLIGILIGLTVGYSLIPKVIYGVFLSRYYVPKLITIVSPLPFSLVITITLLVMTIVSVITCAKELKYQPASLLRPKVPKVGKKIFIEKYDKLWNKLSFMWKTTIRNLFRYKKRIIMTVLGVAGCTALLVAGMGINDSINQIALLQYKDIVKYDSMYILKNKINEMDSKLVSLFNKNEIVNPILIYQDAYTFSFDSKTEDVYLILPADKVNFNNYVTLKSTITNKKISIQDNGVIITKQLADKLSVKIGDNIQIRNSENKLFVLKVNDISYNYVSHYIYISKDYYKKIFKEEAKYNSIIANGKIDDKVQLTDYNILVANYTDDIVETFNSFVKGLNKIIILIVVLASLLAFIVLYNLTIINVSERKREIATFKVLGFYDNEINIFIYREILILTIIGILFGLLLGKYLHIFIINTAQTDNILFLRQIKPLSYIISAIMTLIFSILVQLMINRTLKKIDMIDALKSIE